MAHSGRTIIDAVEQAVPSTWDVKTGHINQGPALWAQSPNGTWQIEVAPNPNAPQSGGYNVELHKSEGRHAAAGLWNGTTVQHGDAAAQAVADFIEEATGSYRGRRHEKPRSGTVEDDAGLFDDLF